MNAGEAKALLANALDRLFEAEADLPQDVNERTVAAQLGVYVRGAMAELVPGGHETWKVDNDYNRIGAAGHSKCLLNIKPTLRDIAHVLGWDADRLIGNMTGLVLPDLIVHRRQSGIGEGNLIACELKRREAAVEDVAVDLAKLAGYRSELGYEHAFLVILGRSREECVIHSAKIGAKDIARYVRRRGWMRA